MIIYMNTAQRNATTEKRLLEYMREELLKGADEFSTTKLRKTLGVSRELMNSLKRRLLLNKRIRVLRGKPDVWTLR